MKKTAELKALLKLLDDPDPDVFQHVRDKFLSYGTSVIDFLENEWALSLDVLAQQRIEDLVHAIQFNLIKEDLNIWYQTGGLNLMQGALIINRYQYPDIDEQKIINQIETIKTDIWLSFNYEMSAIEKINLINYVFYNQYGFKGNIDNHIDPQNSFISQVLESKKGNQITLSILYATIAQKLDVPVYGINLPQHFVLGYLDKLKNQTTEEVLFYINAFSKGSIFGKHDVDVFLKQLNIEPLPGFYKPCNNIEIIRRVIRNLVSAYTKLGSDEKVAELNELQSILI
ncbi:MAG: transglutaminase-like domain-containing protein [Sphingobacteriaceae bacterium]|nr:transglutaminase-like domain-containing protein [Sphingobacteriaceae bacterium]